MKLLRVTNIQRGCVYDGPGVRTTVFLKGCFLECPWCSNPETISFEEQYFISNDKCLLLKGQHSRFCENCERSLGQSPSLNCPFGVYEKVSNDYGVDELLELLIRDQDLFDSTRGGVTFSGGEPLFQAQALAPLLEKLNRLSIHIAFETTLVSKDCYFYDISHLIDYWLIDLKIQPQMYLNNTKYLKEISKRINSLDNKNNIKYRIVFVDEMMGYKEKVCDILLSLPITEIELLVCHDLGQNKYKRLNIEHKSYKSDSKKADYFKAFLQDQGLKVTLPSI